MAPAAQASSADAYRQCLSDNGIELPAGGFGGGRRNQNGGQTDAPDQSAAPPPSSADNGATRPSIDPALIEKARQACGQLQPQGGNGPGGGQGRAGNAQALAAYLSCLKDNGVAVPDPAAGGAPGQGAPGQGGQGRQGQGGAGNGGPLGPDGIPRFGLRGLDTTTPAFLAAHEKCKVLIPDTFANGGPAATTTTKA